MISGPIPPKVEVIVPNQFIFLNRQGVWLVSAKGEVLLSQPVKGDK